MDLNSIIVIIVAIVVAYFVIKFIVSPLIKAIAGIIIFLVAIYILQRYFNLNFNFSNVLGLNLNWILNPANSYINKIIKWFLEMQF